MDRTLPETLDAASRMDLQPEAAVSRPDGDDDRTPPGADGASSSPFHCLPHELCARIFGYLHPVADRLPLLALVCKKWRRLLQTTSSLWRSLYIDPSRYDYDHFHAMAVLVRLYGQHVQSLVWNENAPVYESMFALIPSLLNLKCLRLPVLWTSVVLHRLSPLVNLEQIDINGGFEISDRELVLIAAYFPRLRQISLNACWAVTSYGIDAMLQRLTRLTKFKLKINSALRLNDPRSERAISEGERVVHYMSRSVYSAVLSVLCLHFVNIEQEALTDVVGKLPNLKKLSISNCEVRTSKLRQPRIHQNATSHKNMVGFGESNCVV